MYAAVKQRRWRWSCVRDSCLVIQEMKSWFQINNLVVVTETWGPSRQVSVKPLQRKRHHWCTEPGQTKHGKFEQSCCYGKQSLTTIGYLTSMQANEIWWYMMNSPCLCIINFDRKCLKTICLWCIFNLIDLNWAYAHCHNKLWLCCDSFLNAQLHLGLFQSHSP